MSKNNIKVEKRQTLNQYTTTSQQHNDTLELLQQKLTKKRKPTVERPAPVQVATKPVVTIREPSSSSEEEEPRPR
jgi:hypothetical protein